MKAKFQQKRDALEHLLENSPSEYLSAQTALVDDLVLSSYKTLSEDIVGQGFAVIALGGYGRGELYPHSDIDVMVLFHPDKKASVEVVADAILYPLWNTGLDVGHGVRSVQESIVHAQEEYIFAVSLLDARFLCGDRELFAELMQQHREKFVDGCRKGFVEEMKRRRLERRDRFGSHSYLLEPHIKEGRGGMRDVQSMFWTAQVVFGLTGLAEIEGAGLLLPEERESFYKSYDYLIRLRLSLHRVSGRKNDQLYFEQQQDIAGLLGYVEKDGMLAVEGFMRELYAHLHNIAYVTDLFFDHLDEALGLVRAPVKVPDKIIEKGIEVRQGKVHLVADSAQLRAKPHTLVRVMLAMARTGLPLHYRSQKLVSQNIALITDKVRQSPRLTKPILAIMVEAKDLFTVLETMLESGLLPACIPEFSRIETLAQHDLYHIFTVDRHSLQAVAELRDTEGDWPAVVKNVNSMRLLYLATLLHDIGKGSGRDHSEEGAELCREVGRRFNFSQEEIDDLAFVVRYHLFIPENALRRDLSDAAFIQRCAETVGTNSRLAMLYLLSVADSKATGPSAWSDWKASLMYEMYLKVHSAIEHLDSDQSDFAGDVDQGVEWLREQVSTRVIEAGYQFDFEILPADYLMNFSPDDVAGHVQLYSENYRLLRQKPFVEVFQDDEGWKLLFMSVDRPGVLAKVCGVLALHNLAVATAQIFTWKDGTVVDVVMVRPLDDVGFEEKDWQSLAADMGLAFTHRLDLGTKLYQRWSSTYGRKIKLQGNIEPRVVVDNVSSDDYTVIEVYASDKPHLLYRIAQTLTDTGVNIYKAYIATEVEQLIDVFYVLNSEGNKLEDEDQKQVVKDKLLGFLEKAE